MGAFYPKEFAFQTIMKLLHTNCYIANKKQPVYYRHKREV
jgi:hypothetical protein